MTLATSPLFYSPRRAAALFWSIPVVIVLLMWLSTVVFDSYPDAQMGSFLLLGSVVLSGLAVLNTHVEGLWSMPFLSFIALMLFHVGLFFTFSFTGRTPEFLVATDPAWFLAADLGRVTALLSIGFLSFALGSVAPVALSRRRVAASASFEADRAMVQRQSAAMVGSIVLIVSVLLWFRMNIAEQGLLFFLGSYRAYLNSNEGSLVGLSFMGIGLGLVMCVQYLNAWLSRLALLAFGAFALAGFPLGLRGEVLMPMLAAAGVLMKLSKRRPRWLLVVGSAIVLALITIVRQVRSLGLAAVGGTDVSVRLFDAIEEMGASVRVLALSVAWHDQAGEPYALGHTYIEPIIRNMRSLLGLPIVPATDDYGLFNIVVAERAGNIGGSVIAEAHHNFGVVGIVVVLFLWGLVIAMFNRAAATPWSVAFLGATAMLFLMHVRNASTPLFMWGASALGLIAIIILVSRVRMRVRNMS